MLTTTNIASKPGKTASPLKPVKTLPKDFAFASANQQMEGFSGKITEAVAAHESNMQEITEAAKRFGAQLPTEENLKQPPVFQNGIAPARRT